MPVVWNLKAKKKGKDEKHTHTHTPFFGAPVDKSLFESSFGCFIDPASDHEEKKMMKIRFMTKQNQQLNPKLTIHGLVLCSWEERTIIEWIPKNERTNIWHFLFFQKRKKRNQEREKKKHKTLLELDWSFWPYEPINKTNKQMSVYLFVRLFGERLITQHLFVWFLLQWLFLLKKPQKKENKQRIVWPSGKFLAVIDGLLWVCLVVTGDEKRTEKKGTKQSRKTNRLFGEEREYSLVALETGRSWEGVILLWCGVMAGGLKDVEGWEF